MKFGFSVMTTAASGITTLDTMGIPETTMNAIIAISSMILIWLRSVFLIGGTRLRIRRRRISGDCPRPDGLNLTY